MKTVLSLISIVFTLNCISQTKVKEVFVPNDSLIGILKSQDSVWISMGYGFEPNSYYKICLNNRKLFEGKIETNPIKGNAGLTLSVAKKGKLQLKFYNSSGLIFKILLSNSYKNILINHGTDFWELRYSNNLIGWN